MYIYIYMYTSSIFNIPANVPMEVGSHAKPKLRGVGRTGGCPNRGAEISASTR